jgi:hypothetical protein
MGLAVGPLLIDDVLVQATTLEISFAIGCAMAAFSAAALLFLEETKSFVFSIEQLDQPLLMSTGSPHPKMSVKNILNRASAGIRCIFTSKQSRDPGIVFCASLFTLQVVSQLKVLCDF